MQVIIGEDKLIRFSGCKSGEACSIVLRGASVHLLDEAERIVSASVSRGHFRHVRTSATYYLHETRARLALAQGKKVQAAELAALALRHARDCKDVIHELHALVLCRQVQTRTGIDVAGTEGVAVATLAARASELGLAVLERQMATLHGLRP